MGRSRDCRITRDPPIDSAEWEKLVASHDDFEPAPNLVGAVPGAGSIELPSSGAHWWLGHTQGQLALFSYDDGSIHVSGIDDEGLAFAQAVAVKLRAHAHEC